MDTLCGKCGKALTAAWSYCPHCGATVAHEAHQAAEHEHHPARGAFGGLLYGLIAAPILIIAGIMVCLTGWGLLIGVFMIVAGVLAPLAGPLFGMNEHAGKCPSCGTKVITVGDDKVHSCPACSQSFAIDDHGVVRAG